MNIREELVVIRPNLYRYALSRTRNADSAQDLYQEACVRILEREKKFEGSINLIAYGITIIRNLINDQRSKSLQVEYNLTEEAIDLDEPGSLFDIGEALNKVGEDCQQILELKGMGYSYKEISEAIEVRLGTVMSRMSRCRDKFSEIYAG